ncbi:hypothetical protein GGU11DRAFT_812336 [Lentinula aff. detonsa]|nr:hypothetical protein GGU11DRAFT_812336 [Lentinula aff. detonsa]
MSPKVPNLQLMPIIHLIQSCIVPGYYWYPYASPSTPTPIIGAPNQPPSTPIIGAHVQPPSTLIQPSLKPASQSNQVTSIGFGPNSTEPTDPTTRKLERILNVIQDEDWSFGKFLYHFFHTKDEDGVKIKGRTKKHAAIPRLSFSLTTMSPSNSRANSPSNDKEQAEVLLLEQKREEPAEREAELQAQEAEEAATAARLAEIRRKREEKKKKEAERKKI